MVFGRMGETFGSIVVPANRFRNTWTNEPHRRRMLDAAELGGTRIIYAASALEVGQPAVIALRRLGLLRASTRLPKLIDTRSIETFKRRYCASRYYAPILKCHPWSTGPRMERLGVKVLRLELKDGVTRIIDRISARRVLGLRMDPDELVPSSRQAGLRLRKPAIDQAFDGELTWMEDSKSLSVYRSLDKLPFESPSQWPILYARVVELLRDFQMHFELPTNRRNSPR